MLTQEEPMSRNPIVAAIQEAGRAALRGERAEVIIDLDAIGEPDELDQAAIEAFFAEPE